MSNQNTKIALAIDTLEVWGHIWNQTSTKSPEYPRTLRAYVNARKQLRGLGVPLKVSSIEQPQEEFEPEPKIELFDDKGKVSTFECIQGTMRMRINLAQGVSIDIALDPNGQYDQFIITG